jgi:hypothetical protein
MKMKLHRPYIPLEVRRQVIMRQLGMKPIDREKILEGWRAEGLIGAKNRFSQKEILTVFLGQLANHLGCSPGELELHHRPALVNRNCRFKSGNHTVDFPPGTVATGYCYFPPGTVVTGYYYFVGYVPDANDPDYLVYVPKQDHDIETRVRGQGAQLSDLAIARKRKRKERKVNPKGTRYGSQGPRRLSYRGKSEPLAAAKRLEQRGSRKAAVPSRSWPKRKLRSANRWPPKGARKLSGER